MTMKVLLFSLCILGSYVSVFGSSLNCLDNNGDAVPWWFIYKLPDGLSYIYKDSNEGSSTFKIEGATLIPGGSAELSRNFTTTSKSALTHTLQQVWDGKGDSVGYAAYNDEGGDSELFNARDQLTESPKGAHAKGLIAATTASAFWLVHSWPKFPDFTKSSPSRGDASETYGQTFLCTSLDMTNAATVATQLQYFHPDIYDHSLPDAVASALPDLKDLCNDVRQEGANVATLSSTDGTSFTSFAKDNDWGEDLYDDLVSPTLKQSFFWETWRRSPQESTACCSSTNAFKSINIETVDLGVGEAGQFKYTKDHAKIGVAITEYDSNCSGESSKNKYDKWVCVGGINRMSSQKSRGGGTLCFVHEGIWSGLTTAFTPDKTCV